MTIKKAKNKVAMYLRNNFGVSLSDAYKMGKAYAKAFAFNNGVGDHILEGLSREASYDESLEQVMSKYFELRYDYYYDEYHEEFVNVYDAVPKCSLYCGPKTGLIATSNLTPEKKQRNLLNLLMRIVGRKLLN